MNPDINYETEEENLHKLIDFLQRENQQLKELLEQAGIDYSSCVEGNAGALSVSDQGKRILPFAITENAARHFFARFWGREDVYAKRSVNKKSGKAGYFTQCVTFGIMVSAQRQTGQKYNVVSAKIRVIVNWVLHRLWSI